MSIIKTKLVDSSGQPLYYRAPSAMHNSHRNTKRGRTRGGSRGPIGSNNAHNDSRSIEDLIRDCTALKRSNHLAQAVIGARSDHVVGSKPAVEARTSNKKWNKLVEARFADWCDQCDITKQLSLSEIASAVVNSWDCTGGMIAHKFLSPEGNRPSLQMIDVIRLMNPKGKPDSKNYHGGVELSESTLSPLRYHIADWNDQGTSLDHDPKAYNAENILLINNPHLQDINQHRTVPRLSSVIDRFETIERAGTSTWGAYELATYIALFIIRAQAQGISVSEQIAQASVTTGFDVMFWTELQAVCSGMGLPIELVLMRFIRNFAASRAAISVGWKKIEKYQEALKRRFLKPVYVWWLANEQIEGRIPYGPQDEWMKSEWFLPSQPVLDENTELDGLIKGLASGVYTLEYVLRRLGMGDREEHIAKIKIEAKDNLDAGITYGQPVQTSRSEQVVEDQSEIEEKEEVNA